MKAKVHTIDVGSVIVQFARARNAAPPHKLNIAQKHRLRSCGSITVAPWLRGADGPHERVRTHALAPRTPVRLTPVRLTLTGPSRTPRRGGKRLAERIAVRTAVSARL